MLFIVILQHQILFVQMTPFACLILFTLLSDNFPPNMFKTKLLHASMDEYERLSNNTRNLEQKYTEYIIEKYSKAIEEMKTHAAPIVSEDSEKKINELAREKASLEEKLRESELKIKKLEKLENESKKIDKSEDMTEVKSILNEIKSGHQETLNLIKKILNNRNTTGKKEPKDLVEYQNRIKTLEDEIEDLKGENSRLKKNEQLVKEHKDSIVLLKDSIENKDKTILSQKQEINKLNEQLKKERLNNPFGKEDMITETIKSTDPWTVKSMGSIEPATESWDYKKSVDPLPAISKKPRATKNEDKKKVNVGNIMKEENKSFFNDLSFSNSSPVIEKSFKKHK